MSRYNGNNSSIGTSTHTVKTCNYTNHSTKSKYKCRHFNRGSNYCNVMQITCVGCCSKLCNSYSSIYQKETNSHIIPQKNMIVKFPKRGIGMILAVKDTSYMVKFIKGGTTEIFDIKTIQKYLLKENVHT